jgi:cobalt-zinc-cadmium efflux system outer membrane protein
VPFELGGKRARRIDVAEATIRAGDAELAATVAQVRNDVRRAYFGEVVAEERLLILREQRDISLRARDTAQARFDAGRRAASGGDAGATGAGRGGETRRPPPKAPPLRRAPTLNALIAQPLDTPATLTTTVDAVAPLEAEAALMLAQTASTELLSLDRQIEAQRARIQLAQALRVPT